MCIDIVEIWFGIANGQILSNFPPHDSGEIYDFTLDVHVSVHLSVHQPVVRPFVGPFWFPDDNLSKHQWIFTILDMCIDFDFVH